MNSPYFFASISDEYARRGEHVEITRPDGERVLFCGKAEPWMESGLLYPEPPPDVSTCAASIDTAAAREVPVEYPPGEWRWWLAVVALAALASAVWPHWVTP